MNQTNKPIQAIPFFSQTEWEKARLYMDDGDGFRATHAEFLQRVIQFEQDKQKLGIPTARVAIEQTTFIAWCRANGHQINAYARAHYAAAMVLQR